MSTGLYSGTSGLALGVGLYAGNPGLWGGSAGLITGNGASLYLDFLAGAPLDSRVTFTRGSNATLVDSTGKITYAPANLVLRSDDFDNAGSWTKNATTVASNSTTAPDGTLTADTLTATATTAVHNVQQVAGGAGVTLVWSVYAKAGTNNFIQLWHGISTQTYANFNVSTGAVGTVGTDATASITDAGNGWYRCSIRFTTSALGTVRVALVTSATAAYNESWTAAGTESVFIWGAQLEPVTYQTTPSTYVATTSAAYYGPRFDYDPVTLAAKGLLIEEQRTNLVLQSQTFGTSPWFTNNATITANTTVAPDGTTTASKLVEDTSNNLHRVAQVPTLTAVPHTATIYAKPAGRNWIYIANASLSQAAYFNVSTGVIGTVVGATTATIAPAGNGWYRCSITSTPSAAAQNYSFYTANADLSFSYTGDGTSGLFLWGAQLEAGSFATSYIPTVASQVTRSADVASMTGTNYSSWYNPSEGTLVAEFTFLPRTLSGTAVIAYNGSANGRWSYFSSASARMLDGTNTAIAGSTSIPNAINKTASALSSAGMAISLNGAAPGTSAYVGTFGSQDALNIGSQSGAASINGHIRQIAYYNTRLPDATLQALTA
jgi:predicted hotdog family 3-hydroxylacyl-ACP dehydratase